MPADLDRTDRARLTQAALALVDALGCAGVARMDFFLTDNGPVLNEVNTMPGMTAESQVPRMFARNRWATRAADLAAFGDIGWYNNGAATARWTCAAQSATNRRRPRARCSANSDTVRGSGGSPRRPIEEIPDRD